MSLLGNPTRVPQSVTIDYNVSGSFDSITPAPVVIAGTTPIDKESQIYQVDAENLGVIDPDLGIGGSIGPRCISQLVVNMFGIAGQIAAGVHLAYERNGVFFIYETIIDLFGKSESRIKIPVFVPQGSVLVVTNDTPAGPDGFFLRMSVCAPDDPCLIWSEIIIANNTFPS